MYEIARGKEKASIVNSYRAVNLPDCYRILNVSPGAAWNEVRRAYHVLALKFHPDRNLGDPLSEERFKEVSSAFNMLRQYYASKGMQENLHQTKEASAYAKNRSASNSRPEKNVPVFDTPLVSRAWKKLQKLERSWFQLDIELKVVISHQVALKGGYIKVKRSWETLDIRVPQRSREGTLLRLPGKGDPGVMHRERGDLIVRIVIEPGQPPSRRPEEFPVVVWIDKRDLRQRRVLTLSTHEGQILYSLPVTTRHGQEIVLLGKPDAVTGIRTRFLVEVRLV